MKQKLLFISTLFLIIANVLVWTLLGVQRAYANRVYPGVLVATQSLSGLTRDQVVAHLQSVNDLMTQQKVTLHLSDKIYQPTLKQLGYSVNVESMADQALQLGRTNDWHHLIQALLDYQKKKIIPVTYAVDQGTFNDYLNTIGKDVTHNPKDLSLAYENGNVVVHQAESGVSLNRDELTQLIQQKIKPGQVVDISLTYKQSQPTLVDQSQIADAKAALTTLLAQPLKLQAGDVTGQLDQATLFSFVYFETKNNTLTINFDPNKVHDAVAQFAKNVDITPVPKQVSEADNSVIQEGRDGRQLNINDAVSKVMDRLNAANNTTTVSANTDFTAPVTLAIDTINRNTQTISPEYQLGRYPGRYIEVDLSSQRMFLLEGDNYHKTMIISSGKWSTPTPIGTFAIQNHVPVAWSNSFHLYMPHWMAITPDGGYGIHGLPYWPDGRVEGASHIGTPVSHGCIRLGDTDIQYVYDWAPDGTPVVIHE